MYFGPSNVLLVNSMPAHHGAGIILQLRETEGITATIDLEKLFFSRAIRAIHQVNVLENSTKALSGTFEMEPYESVFLKVRLR